MSALPDTSVYIALGSNLGDRRGHLLTAIRELQLALRVEQLSSIYETEPAYVTDQPRFLNMVLRGTLDNEQMPPAALLRFLKNVEQQLGRQRAERFGPRVIDLDILIYGAEQINSPDLTIPHPRLAERAFVLQPLAEIAPNLRPPGQTETVAQLAQRAGVGQVVRVEPALELPPL